VKRTMFLLVMLVAMVGLAAMPSVSAAPTDPFCSCNYPWHCDTRFGKANPGYHWTCINPGGCMTDWDDQGCNEGGDQQFCHGDCIQEIITAQ
jgi:hypothetical protein